VAAIRHFSDRLDSSQSRARHVRRVLGHLSDGLRVADVGSGCLHRDRVAVCIRLGSSHRQRRDDRPRMLGLPIALHTRKPGRVVLSLWKRPRDHYRRRCRARQKVRDPRSSLLAEQRWRLGHGRAESGRLGLRSRPSPCPVRQRASEPDFGRSCGGPSQPDEWRVTNVDNSSS
jgi:hypothetical protein